MILDALIAPFTHLIDKIIPDPTARAQAKLELLKMQGTQDMDMLNAQMAAIIAEAKSPDPWTSRARPSFLYIMYVIILWSIPMGIIASFSPAKAAAIAAGCPVLATHESLRGFEIFPIQAAFTIDKPGLLAELIIELAQSESKRHQERNRVRQMWVDFLNIRKGQLLALLN